MIQKSIYLNIFFWWYCERWVKKGMVEVGIDKNWWLGRVEGGGGLLYFIVYIEFYVEVIQLMD